MARYPGYQVEPLEPAPTKPISLGLANFQHAKPEKEANLPLSPSLEAWFTCQAQTLEGKDRHGRVIKPPLGQKTYPKLPSLKAECFEPSNAPSLLRVSQLPPEWHRLVTDQGRITPETVSFTRAEFGELQSSVSKILAVLSDLDWWVAGVSNLAKDIQPHLSHNENLQRYLFSEVFARVLPFFGGTRDTSDGPLLAHQTEREGRLPLKTKPSCINGHEKRLESEPT